MTRNYDVVALSFPIVYTNDGDYDPDGMLFALRAYRPLLRWAKDQWDHDDERLRKLHERRQLVQLVVDGLWRYERMVEKLRGRTGPERALLAELRIVEGTSPGHAGEDHAHDEPRLIAVRQNYRATVRELLLALGQLTHGSVDSLPADAGTRATWHAQWSAALPALDRAIADWFTEMENDPARRFDANQLAALSRIPAHRVRRLLLNDHATPIAGRADRTPPYDRFNPMRPIPLVRPLVLRARAGEKVTVQLRNELNGDDERGRSVAMHVQGSGIAVATDDGAAVGANRSSLVPPRASRTYTWQCDHQGAWVVNDLGDVRGTEVGTNVHGLFAALVVEPAGATWYDPETGERLDDVRWGDGADVDIRMPGIVGGPLPAFTEFPATGPDQDHREFTVFIHDEPEVHSALHLGAEHTVMPLSYRAEPMPNRLPHRMRRLAEATTEVADPEQEGIDFAAVAVEVDDELGEVFWTARDTDGRFLERVAGEEQHHSSWLFGDPVTPIWRAYKGDPSRVRVIHAGVKETHVYHLHVHQWRAIAEDPQSQLLDSITIGPQTAVTIDPLYGSGSRQHAFGDVIWHCHLYPHFHHGMWGLWRSFSHLVDGVTEVEPMLPGPQQTYADGRFVAYPDGTPCHPLTPLRGRAPEARTSDRPGFPWFVDATFPRKSPPPPAIIPRDEGGRRRLLRMGLNSTLEYAMFPQGCVDDPQSGAVFVDLDGKAREWNAQRGQNPPRILSYDVEVTQGEVEYNAFGWHDRHGHHYRITAVEVRTVDTDGKVRTRKSQEPPRHEPWPESPEPFFPRANHGDVVELRFHNQLGTIPPDHFDLTTPPVECGLHVHLVKFDVLAADGSSTGWNYLAGASCPETMTAVDTPARRANIGLHRWVVDEEFGPCFFHDHLLANYRQKHGLFAALIAEPYGSEWRRPDRMTIAWSGPEAVVEPPNAPPFREVGLGVGDFIPLYDGERPLNAPEELGSDADPGAMGVNYRCAPLTHRGDDPSEWFATRSVRALAADAAAAEAEGDAAGAGGAGAVARAAAAGEGRDARPIAPARPEVRPHRDRPGTHPGDPDTPVVITYAGDHLRVRLIQGSHEESHSFVAHGLRWHQEWKNNSSRMINQQTVGISEAFTLDIDPRAHSAYGPGDHLWQFAAMDDLWLGCWGIVRALPPGVPMPGRPLLPGSPYEDAPVQATPPHPTTADREFVVVARRVEHLYDGTHLTDPWGLVYEVADGYAKVPDEPGLPKNRRQALPEVGATDREVEPLVLRARRGEWVKVTLINEVLTESAFPDVPDPVDPELPEFGPEVSPPRLPIEKLDELGYPAERTVSPRVSLHPALLGYDVVADDGAYVGLNHDGTLAPLGVQREGHGDHGAGGVVMRHAHLGHSGTNWTEYWWYADPSLAPESSSDGPGQVCYLQDMGDVRNHRHHGLVGALVVEPGDVTPVRPDGSGHAWSGPQAVLVPRDDALDGRGRIAGRIPVADEAVLLVQDGLRHFVHGQVDWPVRDISPGDDPEDSGQKGINYRVAPVHRRTMLHDPAPSTPLVGAHVDRPLWLRVVGACDKPRGHTFTVHGQDWEAAPWTPNGPRWGSYSGVTAGWARDVVLHPRHPGDHAYRTGAFRWGVTSGLWGIVRVEGTGTDGDARVDDEAAPGTEGSESRLGVVFVPPASGGAG